MTRHRNDTGSFDQVAALAYLRSPLATRSRCENILSVGLEGELLHFGIDLDAIDVVAERVAKVTRAAYPDLNIPVHGRLLHFAVGAVDRIAQVPGLTDPRAIFDLVMVSVLLDAGAGDAWKFRDDATGQTVTRSEGLAVASLRAFAAGAFSSDASDPLRVDAQALIALQPATLARAFQASTENPLAGLEGRVALMNNFGRALAAAPSVFRDGRPSGLVEYFAERNATTVAAVDVLRVLLENLSTMWPSPTELGGVRLGDVWRHRAAGGSGLTAGMIPFHKLSQWLTYSLFEPLALSGLTISGPGALTGLPEYRNGGLLIDLGVLLPKHEGVLGKVHKPSDEIIIEWRALTVALLDRVADRVRVHLDRSVEQLPLARILQGGTWSAGRQVAAEKRPGGAPPIRIESDGTVF